jgi:hypothetical protein
MSVDFDGIADRSYDRGRKDAFELCANIAAQCAKGVAIEVNGEKHLLGIMMNDPAAAQYATACAIMEAIEAAALPNGER